MEKVTLTYQELVHIRHALDLPSDAEIEKIDDPFRRKELERVRDSLYKIEIKEKIVVPLSEKEV